MLDSSAELELSELLASTLEVLFLEFSESYLLSNELYISSLLLFPLAHTLSDEHEPLSPTCGLNFVEPIIAKLTAAVIHTHAAIDATILNVFLGLTLTTSTSFLSSVFALSFDSAALVSLTAFILGEPPR